MITSASVPSNCFVIEKNSSRLLASRVAEVATMRNRSTPLRRAATAYALSASRVRSSASGASRPVASTPWPSRTIRISR